MSAPIPDLVLARRMDGAYRTHGRVGASEFSATIQRAAKGWTLTTYVFGGPLEAPRTFPTLADARRHAGFLFHAVEVAAR